MNLAPVLGGVAALLLLASSAPKASASAPSAPALPAKPLGKPPAAPKPAKPAAAAPPKRPEYLFPVNQTPAKPAAKAAAAPAKKLVPNGPTIGPVTPAKKAPVKTPAQVAQAKKPAPVKAPAKKPLGKAVAKNAAQQQPAASPAGGVKASPVLEPNRGSLPAGYDPAKAKTRARAVAAHLVKKGPANYSRPELKSWQTQAGLTPDGLYGGSSRGALIYFGVKDPPRPFFAPVATLPYVPPEQRV